MPGAMDCLVEVCQHPIHPDSTWQDFLGYTSLSPWFIYASVALWLLFALDWHSLLFNAGLYINLGIGLLLKVITRVPRPHPQQCPTSGFAFPSLHVMSISYVTGYLLLLALLVSFQNRVHRSTAPWVFDLPHFRLRSVTLLRVQFWLLVLLFGTVTTFVMISRVQLGYHTTGQAIAGLAFGLVIGALWCLASLGIYHSILRRRWKNEQKEKAFRDL